MLTNIFIKNFLLIEKMDIDFQKGFNVITGETGAGKSVLIKAIQTSIGQPFYDSYKLNKDMDSTISITLKDLHYNKKAKALLSDYGIEADNIIIRRTLTKSNRRKTFINDIPVSSSMLKNIAPLLFEIYKQNENQLLLSSDYQLMILDSIAGNKGLLSQFTQEMTIYKDLKNKLNNIEKEKHNRERMIDNLNFEINEIVASSIKIGDYETLKEKKQIQKNIIRITELTERVMHDLYESEGSIYTLLRRTIEDIESLSEYIHQLKSFPEKLNDFYYMIDDIIKCIETNILTEDPQWQLDHIEERMVFLEKLFKKYGNSEKEVLDYLQYAKDKLNELQKEETDIETIKKKLKTAEKKVISTAIELSSLRKHTAEEITKRIQSKLSEMCLDSAVFDIRFEYSDEIDSFTPVGRDKVEFLYSPHYNVESLPLNQITSGGELSRISLAIRSIFTEKENTPISIFDEIDNGIGGEVANKIGMLLREMSRDNQIIVITHLPQIAKYSEHHLFIEKSIINNYPVITSIPLDRKERDAELLRMIGGKETLNKVINKFE